MVLLQAHWLTYVPHREPKLGPQFAVGTKSAYIRVGGWFDLKKDASRPCLGQVSSEGMVGTI